MKSETLMALKNNPTIAHLIALQLEDPRWQIGEGIRIPEFCNFRKHVKMW
jgi:hypothetical protein